MANKRAMVIGCKGMDGSHMVDLLNSKGYEVWGISRQDEPHNIKRYAKQVDEIYNFAGKSDVINPFDNVNELEDIWKIPLTVLEQIKDTNVKFFQASSPLMNELNVPYGAAKLYAHNLVNIYREKFGMFAVSGIMYQHISERQKDHFFAKKITKAAGRKEKVTVNHLTGAYMDYGYAPDYVEAAWMMLQSKKAKDYVVRTFRLINLRTFARLAFEHNGLNYLDYVTTEMSHGAEQGEPEKHTGFSEIYGDLGWVPKTRIEDTIKIMVDHAKTL